MPIKNLIYLLICCLFLASCNLPIGQGPVASETPSTPDVDVVATSVELTTAAKLTEIAAASAAVATATVAPVSAATETPDPALLVTPSPTPCEALVTANTVANVRVGPGTAYDIVGALSQGATARIAGRNDANTWWYIEYTGGVGGHAWIAGSVTTAACLPAVVQVVAAPPLPTAAPTATEDTTSSSSSAGAADLYVSEFTISPSTPIQGQNAHVRIGVYNHGDKAASQFTVQWFGLSTFPNPSCSWDVWDVIPPSGGKILQCDFVFNSWYPVNKTSLVIVDTSNHVAESNEGNNQGTISPFGVNKP